MEIRLIPTTDYFLNDVQDVPRAFFPTIIIKEDANNFLEWKYYINNNKFLIVIIKSNLFKTRVFSKKFIEVNDIENKKNIKNFIKISLYKILSNFLKIELPYGAITGVRPIKMYYELSNNLEYNKNIIVKKYHVSKEKAELLYNCAKFQFPFINRDPKGISLFINIPFCPTRCDYCSFISNEISKIKRYLYDYVNLIKTEIFEFKKFIKNNNFMCKNIYIGGGTPSSLPLNYLVEILNCLTDFNCEFTVECGRPDTINISLLNELKKHNVTRISINPQTFKQDTLDLIGRKHTIQDTINCFEIVKDFDFIVNADLICGLPNENLIDFQNSINTLLQYNPQNITLHTLSLKKGSILYKNYNNEYSSGITKSMINYGYEILNKSNYKPYYLYRQKNMFDSQENTGFCVNNTPCLYNIDIMQESISIYGIGAGAMSKIIIGDRIERFFNNKDINGYISNFIDSLKNKKLFFDNIV